MSLRQTTILEEARQGTIPIHQSGQSALNAILSENINWKPFAAFPPSVRLAVLVGQPSEPGPYVIRVRVPHRVKLMPHKHPEDRIYTVISGVFYIGLGDEFDANKLEAYPREKSFHGVSLDTTDTKVLPIPSSDCSPHGLVF